MTCHPARQMPLELSNYLAHASGPTSPDAHVQALLAAVAGHRLRYAHREVIDRLAHRQPARARALVAQLVDADPGSRAAAWTWLDDQAGHADRATRGLNVIRNRRGEVWQ